MVRCDPTLAASTGWLKRIPMTTVLFVLRYQATLVSCMVGVVNENRYCLLSVCPLTAVALASIATSYFVANGNPIFGSGVKTSVVVPAQRNVPFTSGAMRNH